MGDHGDRGDRGGHLVQIICASKDFIVMFDFQKT